MARFGSVHAFVYNSAGSGPIWMKSGGDAEFAGVENAAPYCSDGKRGSGKHGTIM